jgi:hypothetical protein
MSKEEKIVIQPTERGFQRGKFTDAYGHTCSIQESSRIADETEGAYLWLGVENLDGEFQYLSKRGLSSGWQKAKLQDMYPDCDIVVPDRMHLSQSQVKELLPLLQHFAEHGELPRK